MNWQAISFDWNQVRAFLATAEEGSLSAAARVLGQTQPTLGRQVTALETDLGVTLFERVGRSLVLTQSGIELLDHVRAMGEAAARVSLTASGQSQAIEGDVRITASDIFSAYMMPTFLTRVQKVAPLVRIDVVAANDIRDLQRREADIAVRHVRPEQPDLIARLVREASGQFCAATSYLEKHGRPKDMADLANHHFVNFGDPDRMASYLQPMGVNITRDNFYMGSESGIVAWEMVKQGLGVTIMSDWVMVRTPGIERLFPDQEPFKFPVWLTTHRELHTSRRIRLVFDMLADYVAEIAL